MSNLENLAIVINNNTEAHAHFTENFVTFWDRQCCNFEIIHFRPEYTYLKRAYRLYCIGHNLISLKQSYFLVLIVANYMYFD